MILIDKMFIDDERWPPFDHGETGSWVVVRDYAKATDFMFKNGCPEFISFDHDLGGQLSGYDIAYWMVERDMNCKGEFFYPYFRWEVHSQNPIGAERIDGLLFSYFFNK